MSQESLVDAGRALNENFYRQRDRALLEYLASQAGASNPRAQLVEVSEIDDSAVLDGLIQAGVTAETFAALALLPLVRVAWADGEVQDRERDAILRAAQAESIAKGSANYQLLEGWLGERPEPVLFEAWRDYVKALARELSDESLAKLRRITLDRARRIAEATGGILGLGNKVSQNEELVLVDLAHAFERPTKLL